MTSTTRNAFIDQLAERFGRIRQLPYSRSLYEFGDSGARLYYRYSKRHPGDRTFYGLRSIDLHELEGHLGILCFVWDGQEEPLFVPYSDFEEVFAKLEPASDGQYKVQVLGTQGGTELYIANAGRFSAESYQGWSYLASLVSPLQGQAPTLNHIQVQTLLGSIGALKGFDVWIPTVDRARLDWSLASTFSPVKELPGLLTPIAAIAEEIDVIWVERGANHPVALYEVKHSTPIYSGLLRFNDIHLALPSPKLRFGVVSNDDRRALFVRQLSRPTFRASGLGDLCTFMEYGNGVAPRKWTGR